MALKRLDRITVAAWAAVAACILILAWNFDPFGRRKRAEQKAADATASAEVFEDTAQAMDRIYRETVVINSRSEKAQADVQQAPGADSPIPDGVRDAWLSGLRDLRAPAEGENPR